MALASTRWTVSASSPGLRQAGPSSSGNRRLQPLSLLLPRAAPHTRRAPAVPGRVAGAHGALPLPHRHSAELLAAAFGGSRGHRPDPDQLRSGQRAATLPAVRARALMAAPGLPLSLCSRRCPAPATSLSTSLPTRCTYHLSVTIWVFLCPYNLLPDVTLSGRLFVSFSNKFIIDSSLSRPNEREVRGQHPVWAWFKSQLLHLAFSSSLLRCLGKQRKVAVVLGRLDPCGRPR